MLLLIAWWDAVSADRRWARPLALSVLLLTVTAAFLWLRSHAGGATPGFGSERYDVRPGANLVVNAGLLVLALGLPGSTLWMVDAVRDARWGAVALLAAGALALIAWTALGLARAPYDRARAVRWIVCGSLVVTPVVPLNRVSELYAYPALPFAALGIGIAAAAWWNRLGRFGRIAMALASMALAAVHMLAVTEKVALAIANGDRATRLLAAIEPWVARVPAGGTLVLVEPDSLPPGYSVFRMPGLGPVRFAEPWLRDRYGRPDLTLRIARRGELAGSGAPGRDAIVLDWRDDALLAGSGSAAGAEARGEPQPAGPP